jgi:hypothetical protein
MDDAELVVVRATPEAAVERTVEIARFPLEARPTDPHALVNEAGALRARVVGSG